MNTIINTVVNIVINIVFLRIIIININIIDNKVNIVLYTNYLTSNKICIKKTEKMILHTFFLIIRMFIILVIES